MRDKLALILAENLSGIVRSCVALNVLNDCKTVIDKRLIIASYVHKSRVPAGVLTWWNIAGVEVAGPGLAVTQD